MQTSYLRDGCNGQDIETRIRLKTLEEVWDGGVLQISCSRQALAKSAGEHLFGLSDLSRLSNLGRIPSLYVVLRTMVPWDNNFIEAGGTKWKALRGLPY